MTYAYIERTYGVTPVPGERIRHHVNKREGVIRGVRDDPQYVQVLFDGDAHALPCHPTEMDYLGKAGG